MSLVQVLRSSEVQQALRQLPPSCLTFEDKGKHHQHHHRCPSPNDGKESGNDQHLSWYGVDLSRVGAVCLFQAVKRQDSALLGSLAACGARFHHANDATVVSRTITLLIQALSSTTDPNRIQRVLEILEGCLQVGLHPNHGWEDGGGDDSLLYRMSSTRSIPNAEAVVALLVRHGAKVNLPSYTSGMTPLMMACRAVNADMVHALLLHGADVSARDTFGRSLLYHVMVDHWRAISIWKLLALPSVAKLVNEPCTLYGRTILHEAILELSEELLEQLLHTHRELDTRAVDQHGWTALHYASFTGNATKIKLVLQKCRTLDPNVRDFEGRTPLHVFGLKGRAPPGGADYGALMAQIFNDDKTLVASRGWQPSVWHANIGLELLLTSGADPLAVDAHGNLPFGAFCVLDDLHHFNHVYKIMCVAALCGGISSTLLK
uniref:Uncharacterized protein n=1 Tax=Amphora coffeiformis TaxID=265554 RepID=A0A7S3L6Q8_9STRA|mmetsp:Transcript_14471/g.27557  ORF Transcript_14471/g.27557 Transcript_14471/m.27557 type:complete len:433 (+) Transcript_14471:55-1353(+)|eukprot:scaffold1352_cov180-Amphora_coffeaeformis.AAC.10